MSLRPGRPTSIPFIRGLGKCGEEYLFQVTNYGRGTLMKITNRRGEVWNPGLRPGQSTVIKSRHPDAQFTMQFWGR
jgi:hypothetical protein